LPKQKAEITKDSWRNLYALASKVYEMAPWNWMGETAVFGIEIPGREVFFVSVMGALGELLAVVVYPGIGELTQFWEVQAAEGGDSRVEQILEIPQIHLAFVSRQHLDASAQRRIKDLGLRFRGPQAWPEFLSYRPGYAPYSIDGDEATMLEAALRQIVEIAPRFQKQSPIDPDRPDRYLVRTPDGEEYREIPPLPAPEIKLQLSDEETGQWRSLRISESPMELDFFLLMTPIAEGKDRPFYPYLLLGVEAGSGLVVLQDMLTVDESVPEMLGEIPKRVVKQCARLGTRPAKIRARAGRLAQILQAVVKPLEIQVEPRVALPHLDPAKTSVFAFMMGGPR